MDTKPVVACGKEAYMGTMPVIAFGKETHKVNLKD
jgi:hypothetical protein